MVDQGAQTPSGHLDRVNLMASLVGQIVFQRQELEVAQNDGEGLAHLLDEAQPLVLMARNAEQSLPEVADYVRISSRRGSDDRCAPTS